MKKEKLFWLVFNLIFAVNFVFCEGIGDFRKPELISNMFGTDSSAELVLQWHNFSMSKQTIQIIEDSGSFDKPFMELEVTGTKFSSAGENGEFEERYLFRTLVTGLKPATLYKYRIGSRGFWSDEYSHLTSGGRNRDFSFVAAADPQSRDAAGMRETLEAAVEYDEDTRFFLIAGDITDEIAKRPSEIINYTSVAGEFNKTRPIAATMGNHDSYGITGDNKYRFNNDDDGCGTIFNAFVAFPRNGHFADETKALSYYFYYNDVLIVMLNAMVSDNANGHYEQAEWLENLLEEDRKAGKSKYIIVCSHVGPFSGRSVDRYFADPMRQAYGYILTEYEVDIFFSGHDHIYTRSNPIKIEDSTAYTQIDPGPTEGGTVYSIVSSTGPKFYYLDSNAGESAANGGVPRIYPVITRTIDEQAPGIFVNVKVTEEKLIVTAIRADDGFVIDSYEVAAKR